jgi:large subunit ribosomal protein L27
MSKTKAGGKARQHSTRAGKRLGIKIYGGQSVQSGAIIVRQKGTKYHPGPGVGLGRDHTIFAVKPGKVAFSVSTGQRIVSVI